MKKFFLIITLFLGLSLKQMYSMESSVDTNKIQSLSMFEITEQIQKVYLEIPFPSASSKDPKSFIQQIMGKKIDISSSNPTFDQLNLLLSLVIVFQPKLEILDLSNCGLTKLPPILKTMENLKSINISLNDLDSSEFENLPSSLEFLIMSETKDSKIHLPSHLKKLKTTTIIPTPKIIDL